MEVKVVAGRKAPNPTGYRRKKCRGVVCGNFEAASEEPVYTSNVDGMFRRAIGPTSLLTYC